MKTTVCNNGDKLYVINLVMTEKERQELSSSLFDLMFTRYSNHKCGMKVLKARGANEDDQR